MYPCKPGLSPPVSWPRHSGRLKRPCRSASTLFRKSRGKRAPMQARGRISAVGIGMAIASDPERKHGLMSGGCRQCPLRCGKRSRKRIGNTQENLDFHPPFVPVFLSRSVRNSIRRSPFPQRIGFFVGQISCMMHVRISLEQVSSNAPAVRMRF